MTKTNQNDIPWTRQASPKGKYAIRRRSLSAAAGSPKDAGTWGGGHPFDVELATLEPGDTNFPLHQHSAQWEAYLILSGSGTVRTEEGKKSISAGDYLVFPPGEAHQIINTSRDDLVYYVIADNPQADVIFYPESKKWMVKPQKEVFEMTKVDYFAGEE